MREQQMHVLTSPDEPSKPMTELINPDDRVCLAVSGPIFRLAGEKQWEVCRAE